MWSGVTFVARFQRLQFSPQLTMETFVNRVPHWSFAKGMTVGNGSEAGRSLREQRPC